MSQQVESSSPRSSQPQLKRCGHKSRLYRNEIRAMTCQSDCMRASLPLQITLVAEINQLLDDGAVDYNKLVDQFEEYQQAVNDGLIRFFSSHWCISDS
ncbi:hypothetical protein [Escherichia coli]|uniref:hypothetical protein n=1 Tax=Escherichia coli TaxID=562 RepID=UPI00203F7350|nr:hypothetical protein [Escherichia coli]